LEGRVISATASADTFAGKSFGAIGYALAEIVSDRERTRFEQSLRRIADGKTASATVEATIVAGTVNDGGTPMEFKLSAITGVNGKPTSIAVWLRDLSFEKANEAAANVQGTHLLDLVENVSDACVVEGADGSIEMLNDVFCQLFEITEAPQSMVGMSCATLFETASIATEKRIGPLYFPLDTAGSSNQHDLLEFQLISGETVVQSSLAVDNESGIAGRMHLFHLKVARASTMTVDENQLAGLAAKQMALIEKIARDLVIALEGASSAVLRGEQLELPGQVLNQFRRVENATASAFDSVAGLLDFSRIEGAPILLESGAFSLRESIAVMIASIVMRAEHLRVQLRVHIEQDVPDEMTGDGARLILALRNLIDCALLSMPAEIIASDRLSEIALTISPEYASGQKIHLAFSIEHTNRSSAAKPKSLPPSAVMQLALARQIVRALVDDKGKIDITERKNGATYAFTAVFPFGTANPPQPRPAFVTLTGLPALIVSENIEERKQLSELMKSWRMHPREADNASMAIQLLLRLSKEGSPIPLVITSNELAYQDGFLLAFRIKHHPQLKHTAVIMLSTTGKPGDAIACRENGVSAYLRQPISSQQLNEAIATIMGAQDNADTTDTLITRHSLRESKKASVLIIDAVRDQAMIAVGGLKKRGYQVILVSNAEEALKAMGQEEFDVVVVDPTATNFGDGDATVETIRLGVGTDRPMPKILLASESPIAGPSPYDGMVLKPYIKGSLVNAVEDVLPRSAGQV
ncbi:MAG: response regulator, partial [Pseudomonadota bacterium]